MFDKMGSEANLPVLDDNTKKLLYPADPFLYWMRRVRQDAYTQIYQLTFRQKPNI